MITRYFSLTAVAVLLSAAGAFAADMPQAPPPDVVYAPDDSGTLCGGSAGRHVDRVWKPGQVAYIVAGTCSDHSLAVFLRMLHLQPRENVLVYYNGGSWDRTDIRSINVPYQPQLH